MIAWSVGASLCHRSVRLCHVVLTMPGALQRPFLGSRRWCWRPVSTSLYGQVRDTRIQSRYLACAVSCLIGCCRACSAPKVNCGLTGKRMNHYRNLSRSVVLIWPFVKKSPIMLGLSCLVSVQPQGLLWLCQTNSRRGRLGFLWRRLVARQPWLVSLHLGQTARGQI